MRNEDQTLLEKEAGLQCMQEKTARTQMQMQVAMGRGARATCERHSWIQEHIPGERHRAAFHETPRRCPPTSTVPVPESDFCELLVSLVWSALTLCLTAAVLHAL